MNKFISVIKRVGVEYVTLVAVIHFSGTVVLFILLMIAFFVMGKPISFNGFESHLLIHKSLAFLLCAVSLLVSGSYLFYFRGKLINYIRKTEPESASCCGPENSKKKNLKDTHKKLPRAENYRG